MCLTSTFVAFLGPLLLIWVTIICAKASSFSRSQAQVWSSGATHTVRPSCSAVCRSRAYRIAMSHARP